LVCSILYIKYSDLDKHSVPELETQTNAETLQGPDPDQDLLDNLNRRRNTVEQIDLL